MMEVSNDFVSLDIIELLPCKNGKQIEVCTESEQFSDIEKAYKRYNELCSNPDVYGVNLRFLMMKYRANSGCVD